MNSVHVAKGNKCLEGAGANQSSAGKDWLFPLSKIIIDINRRMGFCIDAVFSGKNRAHVLVTSSLFG